MKKMRVLNHGQLLALNGSSIRAGRRQNLRPDRLAGEPRARYWINEHHVRESDGSREVRLCVVLNLYTGQTAWLDVAYDEFLAIPEMDLRDDEWETAMCAGTPPPAP